MAETANCAACSPFELKEKLQRRDDIVLLDVRTSEELSIARIDGCVHIPLNELPTRVGELEPSRGQEIITMCHHGMRSEMAQQFLLSHGFAQVRNLTGGIDAYAEMVDSSLPRY